MAFALNTGVLAVEAAGGIQANSLSLLLDAVHNLSDELGLLLLVLAYTLRTGLSGRLLQSANFFNSVGLTAISAVLLWQAAERLAQPVPVLGSISVVAGLLGAAGNWAVASVLRVPSRDDAAIRLAYVHNLGDVLLSLAPVAAGVLVLASGWSMFDSVIAVMIGAVIIGTTARTALGAHKELLWPENVRCGH